MTDTGAAPEAITSRGPGPFVTERHYQFQGRRHVWRSRDHRRGLRRAFRPGGMPEWRPEVLNTWIGLGFALGSALFITGSVLALGPSLAAALGLSTFQVNAVFFIGSIFFTAAAYLQLYQAANAPDVAAARPAPARPALIGWLPHEIGWLSSFMQFCGTVLFNISTLAALWVSGSWLREDLTIWIPDIFGSILFLLSGYLAFAETAHAFFAWQPSRLSWWVVAVNLAGCVAFMVSAIYAFVPSGGASPDMAARAVLWTLYGANCFLIGAVLQLFEETFEQP
ncbi:MAG: hypothetical protein AAF667_11560 [Pseudomonadota bacterium]